MNGYAWVDTLARRNKEEVSYVEYFWLFIFCHSIFCQVADRTKIGSSRILVGGTFFPGSDQCGLTAENGHIEYEYEYEYEHTNGQAFESNIVSTGKRLRCFHGFWHNSYSYSYLYSIFPFGTTEGYRSKPAKKFSLEKAH